MQNRRTTDKINQTKSWFFEKINEIDKTLPILTKGKRKKNQQNYKGKRRHYNRHHRNSKNHKRLL